MDIVTLGAALNGSKAYTDQVTQSLMGGVHYRGSVSYYGDLPNDAEEGDSYTVKYAGTSGTIADGTEYTWGYDTDTQDFAWISFSKDTYSKAEIDNKLVGSNIALTGYAKGTTAKQDVSPTDNVNQGLGKIEKRVSDNENNISKQQDTTAQGGNGYAIVNGKRIYITDTEPTTHRVGDVWIDKNNIIQIYTATDNLSPEISAYGLGYIDLQGILHDTTNRGEKVSDYIQIEANQSYTFSVQPNNFPVGFAGAWRAVAFYDSNKNYISRPGENESAELTATSPPNAAFARLMLRTYGDNSQIMFNKGATSLPYIPQYIWKKADNPISYTGLIKGINHRGYNRIAPENTIPAYILSKEMGFEYVETDISFTSDGIAVLLHDNTIDRTSDGTGNISDMTYAQVSQYDFGSWKSAAYAGTKIPTFEEFIVFCRNVGLKVYAELKGSPTQVQVDNVCAIVKKYGMENNVSWIAFNSTALEMVLTNIPTARVGFLISTATTEAVTTIAALKTSDNAVFLDCSSISDSIISDAITATVPVEIWTVNSATKITAANNYISGFTSDILNADKILTDIELL